MINEILFDYVVVVFVALLLTASLLKDLFYDYFFRKKYSDEVITFVEENITNWFYVYLDGKKKYEIKFVISEIDFEIYNNGLNEELIRENLYSDGEKFANDVTECIIDLLEFSDDNTCTSINYTNLDKMTMCKK